MGYTIETDKEQAELFDFQNKGTSDRIKSILRFRSSETVTLSYEALIAFIALIAVLFVLVYAIGYLRGKALKQVEFSAQQALSLRQVSPSDLPATALQNTGVLAAGQSKNTSLVENAPQQKPAAPSAPLPNTALNSVAKSSPRPYTIQVVAYRNQNRALSEIAKLRTQGFASRIISGKTYNEVCVGEYVNAKAAQNDLKKLRSKYPDCYLRKI